MAVTLNTAVVPTQTVLLAGCAVITGNCTSFTVTVNVQVAVMPQASVAVEVTVVVPIGNTEPDAGTLTTVTAPQLSVAVTVKFTTAVQEPTGVKTVILAGQVITGGVWSFTVIICVHSEKLPHTSVALYVLVNVNLLAHVWLVITSLICVIVITPPQLSVAVTDAVFTGGTALAQLTVTGAGQVITGGV